MVLGTHGRIIKEVRERATQILVEKIQRNVSITCSVKRRTNSISDQNRFDSETGMTEN
jgi:GTPase Era involved in 16S rRNA processing